LVRARHVLLCCALIIGTALVAGVLVWMRAAPATATPPIQIDAGTSHSCAVTSAGGVRCWGENGAGQLGDGTVVDDHEPADVAGVVSGIADVAAGSGHSCALTTGGGVKCWGDNAFGQLGDGTLTPQHEPVDVAGLGSGVAGITSGSDHVCALLTSGAVTCWGNNLVGELGNGESGMGNHSSSPVSVCTAPGVGAACTGGVPLSDVVAIGAGQRHTCAVLSTGVVRCWGLNEFGQIGDNTAGDGNPDTFDHIRVHPTTVISFSGTAVSVSGGSGHTCALNTGGLVQCWGLNDFGQLGDGTLSNRPLPITADISDVVGIDAGELHSCALTIAGAGQCWGGNSDGQLGDGTTTDRSLPVDVSGLTTGAGEIAAGGGHTCALAAAGVVCWGANASGQLGSGTTKGSTTPVTTLGSWAKEPTPPATSSPSDTATPTQTQTPTPSSTRTPTPTLTPDAATDTDGDGCSDAREVGPNPAQGGGRDPGNVWDFFDTPNDANVRDRAITVGDLGRVVARFGSAGSKALDPLSIPPPAPAYYTAFDRTSLGEAPNGHPQGPNGSVTAQDIALIVAQFGHSCV
jgi:alpha-tubulin suppressor-like RCC1 family protein